MYATLIKMKQSLYLYVCDRIRIYHIQPGAVAESVKRQPRLQEIVSPVTSGVKSMTSKLIPVAF